MKLDYEYIIEILDIFLSHNKPNIRIDGFDQYRNEDENKFYFHILIMQDKNIIQGSGNNPNEIGINFNSNSDTYIISSVPWRLTADGHDFAKAAIKPSIKTVITSKFKEEGLSAVIDITKKLASKHAEKLLDGVLDD